MAFPVVAAKTGGGIATASTSHTLTLPSGIVDGDLLVAVLSVRVSDNIGITGPDDWTVLAEGLSLDGTGNAIALYIIYHLADGSEGSSVTFTTVNSGLSSYSVLRITGANVIETGTQNTGGSTTTLFTSLSVSWGEADNLWLAAAAHGGGSTASLSSGPTNYSGSTEYSGITPPTTGTLVDIAYRQLTDGSEAADEFTLSSTDAWITFMVGIGNVSFSSKNLLMLGVG